jgi:protocatechuate 3,4-dioxygenase beta subunit
VRWVLAAALLVAAGLLWWLAGGDDARRARTEREVPDVAVVERPAPPAPPAPQSEPDAAEHVGRVETPMLPPDCVGGTVRKNDLAHVSAVTVRLRSKDGARQEWETSTDEIGRFVFRNIPAGSYRLVATHPVHARVVLDFIRSGNRATDFGFYMRPGGSILARVLGPRGAPLPGQRIVVHDGRDGAVVFEGRTDAEGQVRASNLAQRTHRVSWHRDDEIRRRYVNVRRNEQVEVVFSAGALLYGTILDGLGGPLAGAVVTLRRVEGGGTHTRANPDGRYELSGLAPGKYDLSVTEHGAWRTTVTQGRIEFAGGAQEHSIRLEPTEIRGRVTRAATGKPFSPTNLHVQVYRPGSDRSSGSRAYATPDVQGRYFVRGLPPGRYEATVLSQGAERFRKEHQRFELHAGETVRDLDFAIEVLRFGKVVAIVTEADGRPAHSAIFEVAEPDGSRRWVHVTTLGEGRWELKELEVGDRQLYVTYSAGVAGPFPVRVVEGETVVLPLRMPETSPRPGSD